MAGEPPSEIRPYIAEAMARFGDVEPGQTEWLTQHAAICWYRTPERDLMRIGDLLTLDALAAAGFDRWAKVGRESWEALTTQGRAQLQHGFARTIARARARFLTDALIARSALVLKPTGYFAGILVSRHPDWPICAAIEPLIGTVIAAIDAVPTLPMPACDLDFCHCQYRLCTHVELQREK